MGKARAARRDQRQAKRAVARGSRDTKYANQKGGISKSSRRGSHGTVASDEAPMAVIRDGKAVWIGADAPAEPAASLPDDEQPSGGHSDRMSAHKKLRSLQKKLRRVTDLKLRQRQGEEFDGAQLALVRSEAALREQIRSFEQTTDGAADDASDAGAGDDDAGVADGDDGGDDAACDVAAGDEAAAAPTGSRLQVRRELKKRKHLELLRRREEKKRSRADRK